MCSICRDPEHIVKRNLSLQRSLHEVIQTAQDREELVAGVHNAAEQLDM